MTNLDANADVFLWANYLHLQAILVQLECFKGAIQLRFLFLSLMVLVVSKFVLSASFKFLYG